MVLKAFLYYLVLVIFVNDWHTLSHTLSIYTYITNSKFCKLTSHSILDGCITSYLPQTLCPIGMKSSIGRVQANREYLCLVGMFILCRLFTPTMWGTGPHYTTMCIDWLTFHFSQNLLINRYLDGHLVQVLSSGQGCVLPPRTDHHQPGSHTQVP